ncbi:MAG: hypothetical protein WCI01_04120 [Chlorobiaceae bacterium]
MMKYIILFIFFFLLVRAVVRTLRKGLFFIRKVGGPAHGVNAKASSSSGRHIEEADYEVIESRLQHKERDD